MKVRKKNLTIGFVPTMGALHDGHLSLVALSQKANDITIVSIFVNPAQFGPNEDLESYPRTVTKDLDQLKNMNVDCVFLPTMDEIYPNGTKTATQIKLQIGRAHV